MTREKHNVNDKKSRKSDSKIILDWKPQHDQAWTKLRKIIAHVSQVNLRNYDPKAIMIIYTDASGLQ